MKSKGFLSVFFIVTVLFLMTVLALSQQQAKSAKSVAPSRVDPAQSLAAKVFEDGERLKVLFREKHFEDMAKVFDSLHAVLITPDYQIIYGKDSAAFWKMIWDARAFLIFEPSNFHFSSALGTKETKEGTMDGAAFVVQKIRVLLRGEKEEIIRNQSLLFGMPGRHRNDCQWY